MIQFIAPLAASQERSIFFLLHCGVLSTLSYQARGGTPICISLSSRSIWITNGLLRQCENVATKTQNLYLRVVSLSKRVFRWNFPGYLSFPWTWYEWKKYKIWWNKTRDMSMFWYTTLDKQAVYYFPTVLWAGSESHKIRYTYSWSFNPYMVKVFDGFSL